MNLTELARCGIKLTKTRHPFLRVGRLDATTWQYFNASDESNVGQTGLHYRTKLEALADGPRFWSESYGWNG